ncbi:cytochrome P450 3A43 [Rhipicephalus sanguineus]|uniref:cytochrome P450 3A43 n=1 Tax=Rhipicephalus sanguineus TaxID=34632 RepID=UPI0020C4F75C|nr:cytochrome P450 3A43 [Rhipicephalus sanguineus]
MEEWARLYGKVYGYYEGETPKVVISDMEVIKECFVKKASVFTDRPPLVVDIEPVRSSLIGLKGDDWKSVRGMLNPSFTSAKIKRMLDTIHQCCDITKDILRECVACDGYATANISAICQGLSLDIITKCALGWQSDCQRNKRDPVIETVAKILTDSGNWINDACMVAPFLGVVLSYIFPFLSYGKLFARVEEHLQRLLESRKRAAATVPDIVQLMLDAQKTSSAVDKEISEPPGSTTPRNARPQPCFITDRHVMSNCFVLLGAGFDTTACTLAFLLYELAMHPDEQRTLYNDLVAAFPDRERLTYEELQTLKRFDVVISECLRLHPPLVLTTARLCQEDTRVATGHVIPRGSHVILPTWNVLHSSDLWVDPYSFDPDRFVEGTDGAAVLASVLAFGIGPRECIGKRLALLELKVALSKLVRFFEFSVCNDTNVPLKVKVPLVSLIPEQEIVLRVELRSTAKCNPEFKM